MNGPNAGHDPERSTVYRIRLRGRLDRRWADRFDGMRFAWEDGGSTLLAGPVADQAALHGLLKKVRDLGIPLISINEEEEHMASVVLGERERALDGAAAKKRDRGTILSTVWIFALVNYIYADIFSLFFAPAADSATGAWGQGAVLVFAILMETGIAMVLLSRVLRYALNRWLNVIVGAVQALFVTWSLFGSPPKPFYVFFVALEVASFLFIVVYAWTWKRDPAPRG